MLVLKKYTKARLLIAVSGSYEPELRKLAGTGDQILFLRDQSGGDLDALYLRAIAPILPSFCYEIFPNVVLEAFCHRTPAIIRKPGGMPEIIHTSGGSFILSRDQRDEVSQQSSCQRYHHSAPTRIFLCCKTHKTLKYSPMRTWSCNL